MTAQTERDVARGSVEDCDLAIVTTDLSLGERRREIGDALVRGGDEVDRIVAAGAGVVESVPTTWIGSHRVQWSSVIGADAMQDNPRTAHGIHATKPRTHDS